MHALSGGDKKTLVDIQAKAITAANSRKSARVEFRRKAKMPARPTLTATGSQ